MVTLRTLSLEISIGIKKTVILNVQNIQLLKVIIISLEKHL